MTNDESRPRKAASETRASKSTPSVSSAADGTGADDGVRASALLVPTPAQAAAAAAASCPDCRGDVLIGLRHGRPGLGVPDRRARHDVPEWGWAQMMQRRHLDTTDSTVCADCAEPVVGGCLTHAETCPIGRGIDECAADDRHWFDRHPHTTIRRRRLHWAEVAEYRARGAWPDFGVITGHVVVTQLAPGVRHQSFREVVCVFDPGEHR